MTVEGQGGQNIFLKRRNACADGDANGAYDIAFAGPRVSIDVVRGITGTIKTRQPHPVRPVRHTEA